ncbi:hypothetical protein V5799_013074 [Amblyomma americanum]|uniref:Secreted protein n=1 Tax=Amblyomma americanum TaxID=6943 RepID=A0AAQ4E6W7_AMBAM
MAVSFTHFLLFTHVISCNAAFGRCELPVNKPWAADEDYSVQKARNFRGSVGSGTGSAMAVSFTDFLLFTQYHQHCGKM